jgi:hypothetical protein
MQDGFVPKVNQCGIFVNTKSPDRSDFGGRFEIECPHCKKTHDHWVDGWRKVTASGTKYLKIRLRPKTPGRGLMMRKSAARRRSDMDETIGGTTVGRGDRGTAHIHYCTTPDSSAAIRFADSRECEESEDHEDTWCDACNAEMAGKDWF